MADRTFTAGASFALTPFYYDKNLESLMIHRCTVVQGARPASLATSYGHSEPDFGTSALRFTGIKCRLRPLSQQEQAAIGEAGLIAADYYLDMPCWRAPAPLFDSNAGNQCRIEHVTYKNIVIDEGPFDIQGIGMPGGLFHHFMIRVRRIN